MASETPFTLPTIDFGKLDFKPGTPEWELVRTQVWNAIEGYGFFLAAYNKLPPELPRTVFGELEDLFNLPLETKMRNTSDMPFAGYIGKCERSPLYETVGVDDPFSFSKVEELTKIFWPEGKPSFSNTIHSFSTEMLDLEQAIRRMIVESLGVEKYLQEHMDSTFYGFKVMKYEAPKTLEKQIGLNTHMDVGIMTLLYQNQVDGLELQTRSGEWVTVHPKAGHFIVFIGESLYAWTNGRAYAPYHRVRMTGNQTRYTVALLSAFKGGYKVKTPQELVDEQHPLLYNPFDHLEFLKLLEKEMNNDSFTINTYAPLKARYGVA